MLACLRSRLTVMVSSDDTLVPTMGKTMSKIASFLWFLCSCPHH